MTTTIGGTIREKLRNQPNGFAGLDSNGNLPGTLINRAMTYDDLMDGVVLEEGEFCYCTDTRDVHVGDGSTVGGLFHSSPPKTLTPTGVGTPITNSNSPTSLQIFSQPLKAGCRYIYRARIQLSDANAATNNGALLIRPMAGLDFIPVALPMYQGSGSRFLIFLPSSGGALFYIGGEGKQSAPVFHLHGYISPGDTPIYDDFEVYAFQASTSSDAVTVTFAACELQRIS